MSLSPQLKFYRRMLKHINDFFRDDLQNIKAMKFILKAEMMEHKKEQDPIKIADLIYKGESVRNWMLTDVIRADKKDEGTLKMKIRQTNLQTTKIKPVKNPQFFEFEVPEKYVLKE